MSENKASRNEMTEAWDQVGKAVNEATEVYLKELGAYLGWVQNVRKEMLEQTITASQQLSKIGEAQFTFLTQIQKNLPYWGANLA
jgi:hypothetical protein